MVPGIEETAPSYSVIIKASTKMKAPAPFGKNNSNALGDHSFDLTQVRKAG